MEVSVQVVRGYSSTERVAALIERIEGAQISDFGNLHINGDTDCGATGMVMSNGVRATCSWEPASHVYRVTIQY